MDPTPAPPQPEPAGPDDAAGDDPCPRCGRPVGDAWLVCAWCGEQLAAPAELPVGAALADGRYRVLGVIGRGGFGITYEAGDARLRRRVAIKELFPQVAVRHGSRVLTPPEDRASFRSARERFLREARVLARFTQPGVVRVYEVFEEHGTAYLVMERLTGQPLVDVLLARRAPFGEDEVLDVVGRVAAALRPVHAAGVLHRDINPSNVMLTRHGRIVVIDFGLAQDFTPDRTVGMTRVVTPGYAPLEQYRGEARFGPSTDVYGLAATAYRLATGHIPPSAVERDGGALLRPAHELNPVISKEVSDALGDGLELEPGHRPQDLDSFLARLGVRRLPESPQSILLGTEGTEPAEGPEVIGYDGTADAGPPAATPVDVRTDRPGRPATNESDDDATVAVAHRPPASDLSPPAAAISPPRPPHPATEVDPDHTVVVGRPTAVAPAPAPRPPLLDDTRAVGSTADERTYVPDATAHDRADLTRWERPEPGAVPAAEMPGERTAPSRGRVTVPLAILVVALASAAPVLVVLGLVLLVVPALATVGDSMDHRRRAESGIAGGRVEQRLSPGAMAPGRFLRNVVLSVVRVSPILGVSALLVGAWYVLSGTSLPSGVVEGALRLIGAATAALVLAGIRDGSPRFRTGAGLDWLAARVVGDKPTERLVVLWLVVAILVAGALWLTPDAFPLP